MSTRMPILFFDKEAGLAYAKLKLFMKEALRGMPHELVRIDEPADAARIAGEVPALGFFSAMGAAARGKYKETKSSGKASHVREKATWKALGAFAPLQQQDKSQEEESPGCVGTYWKSKQGAWVCGMRHPLSTDFSARGLCARWLRGAHALGEGQLELKTVAVEYNPPLERMLAGKGLCTFDIETRGFTEEVTLFGFSDASGTYVWDWTPETMDVVREWSQTSRAKVGQNSIKFDVPVLQRVLGVQFRGPLGDTMALQSAYVRQWRYGLQQLVSHYFPIQPWKAMYKAGESEEWLYCGKDAGYTYLAAEHLHRKLGIPESVGLPVLTYSRV